MFVSYAVVLRLHFTINKNDGAFSPEKYNFQVMETKKRTQAADIAEIATKLDGKVNFSSIVYSQQMLSEKYRETGVNDIYFIGKKFGLWFYTSRAALDNLCYLNKQNFPTWVLCENSLSLYEIKK